MVQTVYYRWNHQRAEKLLMIFGGGFEKNLLNRNFQLNITDRITDGSVKNMNI